MSENKELKEAFKLTCHDVGVDCDVEFIGKDFEEIMKKASVHAAAEHNLPIIPPNIMKKCALALRGIYLDENGNKVKK